MTSRERNITERNTSYTGSYTYSSPSQNITINIISPTNNPENANKPLTVNKSYQPNYTHVKRISFGSFQSFNQQSATLSTDSGRNSTNYQASEDSATLDSKKTLSAAGTPAKPETSTKYHRSSFGEKYSGSSIGNDLKPENVNLVYAW